MNIIIRKTHPTKPRIGDVKWLSKDKQGFKLKGTPGKSRGKARTEATKQLSGEQKHSKKQNHILWHWATISIILYQKVETGRNITPISGTFQIQEHRISLLLDDIYTAVSKNWFKPIKIITFLKVVQHSLISMECLLNFHEMQAKWLFTDITCLYDGSNQKKKNINENLT